MFGTLTFYFTLWFEHTKTKKWIEKNRQKLLFFFAIHVNNSLRSIHNSCPHLIQLMAIAHLQLKIYICICNIRLCSFYSFRFFYNADKIHLKLNVCGNILSRVWLLWQPSHMYFIFNILTMYFSVQKLASKLNTNYVNFQVFFNVMRLLLGKKPHLMMCSTITFLSSRLSLPRFFAFYLLELR